MRTFKLYRSIVKSHKNTNFSYRIYIYFQENKTCTVKYENIKNYFQSIFFLISRILILLVKTKNIRYEDFIQIFSLIFKNFKFKQNEIQIETFSKNLSNILKIRKGVEFISELPNKTFILFFIM